MTYYIVAGLARYGGDDGLTLQKRSQFIAPVNLSNKVQFYYICLALLCASIYLVWRIVNSRFGLAVQGTRSNDTRMRAIGFPTYRYKLTCFVIAGTLCGLAGALIANHTDFVSPAMMYWTRSGDLIIMVVLGGMGSIFGPLFGTVALLVLEEVLSGITEYWQIILGPLLLLIVLFARGGIDGLLGKVRHADLALDGLDELDRIGQRISRRKVEADGDGGKLLLVRDGKRCGGRYETGESGQRYLCVAGDRVGRRRSVGICIAGCRVAGRGHGSCRCAGAGDVQLRQRIRVLLIPRLRFKNDAILVGLPIDGGNLPLAESIVERICHALHGKSAASSRPLPSRSRIPAAEAVSGKRSRSRRRP